jgi:cbb3-type cytochrome oxidase subunit 3
MLLIDLLVEYSPLIGLIFFLTIFFGIVGFLCKAKTKKNCKKYAEIALKDD